MKNIYIVGTLLLLLAQTAVAMAPEGLKMPQDVRITINEVLYRKAWVYGVDVNLMRHIIFCESSFNVDAKNISKREASYGLVQINTLVHDVTIEQAKDPEFAIDFLAKNIKKGKAEDMWVTCFTKAHNVVHLQ